MSQSIKHQLYILVFALLLFIPFLGSVHLFDWDEINFAESAREMLVTGNYGTVQIDYKAFWEKPPLFIWMQYLSMHIFGINEMAARLPNAICGLFSILILYRIGRKLYDEKFALLWVLAYAGSVLPFVYFKSGIIDPWFNLFIFIGLYYLIQFKNREVDSKGIVFILCSAISLGLAILTKGPVALLIAGLVVAVYFVLNKFKFPTKWWHILLFFVVLLAVGSAWFIYMALNGKFEVIQEFFVYQIRLFQTHDAGHSGFLLYHPVILFFGVFPASIIALLSYKKVNHDTLYQRDFHKWMTILFWVVLILFTIVRTKIVHYSSLCYFPISFLAAWVAYQVSERRIAFHKPLKILLLAVSSLLSIGIILLTNITLYKDWLIEKQLIADKFALANLQAIVPWSGYEWIVALLLPAGVALFILLLNKKYFITAFISLYSSVALFTLLALYIIAPRVEGYSQRAALDFYESIKGKNCYVCTVGFKSYAPLFYSAKPLPQNSNALINDSLLYGKMDKPVFIVMKNTKKEEFLSKNTSWKYIYERNGFVFCIRYSK